MAIAAAARHDHGMQVSTRAEPGRSPHDVHVLAREARRLIGFERGYDCPACGSEHRAWAPLRSCPDCGEGLGVAVIRRAAFA
ncbi:MAG TPA: hypothetical protein VK919_12525 [Solirubrobacterales bacterium]|nr:hypothetical protein [Solirubrobacterales bacterium]